MKLTKRKGFNFFRSYYDVYNELNNEQKVLFMDALLDKQFLNKDPEDLKGIVKLAYVSQSNNINAQVKGYEDKTGLKLNKINPKQGGSVGGCLGGSVGPSVGPCLQVKEKGKVKEKVKEKEEDKKNNHKFVFRKELINAGGKKELVEDWLLVRKNKKATNTKTAFNNFMKQVDKSGMGLNYILELCVSKSWSGFNSDWDFVGNKKITNIADIKKQQRKTITF